MAAVIAFIIPIIQYHNNRGATIIIDILYEDNHCLVVNKPAGLLSQGDQTGDLSLDAWAKNYLKEKYHKPGNVYVGLIHRLDRPTSGLVLLARTSKAAGRLSEQFRAGEIAKVYWAIVEGRPTDDKGRWVDRLDKDAGRNRSRRVESHEDEGRIAEVDYRVMRTAGDRSKLELRPATGRSHQLRVQLAERGLPIVGDRKYGASSSLAAADGHHRIALHAHELTFTHPTQGHRLSIVAPTPADWPDGWA